MGHREGAAIEPKVAWKACQKRRHLRTKGGGFVYKLGNGAVETVCGLDVPSFKPAHQLVVVIALDAEAEAGIHGSHHDPKRICGSGTAICDVANEDKRSVAGRQNFHFAVWKVAPLQTVAEVAQENAEFFSAAVDVAHDIERAV